MGLPLGDYLKETIHQHEQTFREVPVSDFKASLFIDVLQCTSVSFVKIKKSLLHIYKKVLVDKVSLKGGLLPPTPLYGLNSTLLCPLFTVCRFTNT